MKTYRRSGRAIVWHGNFPSVEEIVKAARLEFPGCPLSDLQLIPCGEDILLEKKPV